MAADSHTTTTTTTTTPRDSTSSRDNDNNAAASLMVTMRMLMHGKVAARNQYNVVNYETTLFAFLDISRE